ncbi:Crp/Fnr family transcriptional regulator [Myxococcus sp. K38C18041901]|uniref:Crp/Fnr family transcriptional regulator n=1 Tax=Myxococcus guangdongensis TaxID=2906760 RepID=UPI0020A83844|nr:cyclic nucleotide-binding domain-containing protein [Myxococcus guangdongensis]MCP3064809.1 Crp/Fnr family transcriptional regulator [Myxococcus guangdongensis]
MTLFEGLPREEVDRISTLVHAQRYACGEVIFHRGDIATTLHIIRKGQVSMRLSSSDGKEVILSLLQRGDFFGETSLLDGAPLSTDAVARGEVDVLRLQRRDFQHYLSTRPQVALGLLTTLSRLVRQVTQRIHDTSFLDARTRLERVLLELARHFGSPGEGGTTITQKFTQTELANLCGLTRESTNKWLRTFVRDGWVRYEGGDITLVQEPRLEDEWMGLNRP